MSESRKHGLLRLRLLDEHTEAVTETMSHERARFQRLASKESAPRVVSSFNLFQTPEPLADRLAGMCGWSNNKPKHGDSYRRKQMAKNKSQTDSCLQCEGDKMLEVRKHASEAFTIMDMLIHAYGPNHKGASIMDYVAVLIEAEKDQRRLVAMLHCDARRRTKEVNDLICALKFISDTTRETYSSGANLSSKSMTIPLTETFRVAIHRLESLLSSDKGLLEGKQPQNAKDFTAELRSPSPF